MNYMTIKEETYTKLSLHRAKSGGRSEVCYSLLIKKLFQASDLADGKQAEKK
jgi:hypothetical protein